MLLRETEGHKHFPTDIKYPKSRVVVEHNDILISYYEKGGKVNNRKVSPMPDYVSFQSNRGEKNIKKFLISKKT